MHCILDLRFLAYGFVYSIKKSLDFLRKFVSVFNFILKKFHCNVFPSTNVHLVITRNTNPLCRRPSRINILRSVCFHFFVLKKILASELQPVFNRYFNGALENTRC